MSEPRRMVPRYDEEALDRDLENNSEVPTHIRVLEKVRAAYTTQPPHVLRHEEVKDGLDRLIQIVDDDRHPPPFDFEFPKMPAPNIAFIDTAELAKLRRDAADARVLRGELERISGELVLLRKNHDALLIKHDALANKHETEILQHRFTKGDMDRQGYALERAVRALEAIRDQDIPEGYAIAHGLYGVIDYLSEIAKYGLKEESEVDLGEIPDFSNAEGK